MNEALIFEHLRRDVPNAKQIEFFKSHARHTAYGGARGGGKSWAARRKLVMLCMRYPNLKAIIVRRTLQDVRDNHITPLMTELNGYAKYQMDSRAFVFPNGSKLSFGYCDNDGDKLQYQGKEYDVICLEEATQFREDWIRFILSSLRSTRTDFTPRAYYTCNPGGPGHAYIKRLFIDRDFVGDENPDDYVFIPAKVYDNRALMDADPDYIKMLKALPANIREAHLEGNWNIYTGQVFTEFVNDAEHYIDRVRTHVIEPFDVPRYWRVYRSFDWGYSKPFAVTYWAVDGDARLYEILEIYGCVPGSPDTGIQYDVMKIAQTISETEREHPFLKGREIRGVADPAIWQKQANGTSIAEVMEKKGIYFDRADNSRIPSIQQVHYRLSFDANGIPMMYIFKNCRDTIRTLPTLMYDPVKPEDVDTKQEDHLFDTMRYVCAANPISSVAPEVVKPKIYNPLDDDEPPRRGLYYV